MGAKPTNGASDQSRQGGDAQDFQIDAHVGGMTKWSAAGSATGCAIEVTPVS